jgi:hypothetical protein
MTDPRKNNSIELIGTVQDRGRRGAPLPGCDCVQCFGYCMVDKDRYHRQVMEFKDQAARVDPFLRHYQKQNPANAVADKIDGIKWDGTLGDSVEFHPPGSFAPGALPHLSERDD